MGMLLIIDFKPREADLLRLFPAIPRIFSKPLNLIPRYFLLEFLIISANPAFLLKWHLLDTRNKKRLTGLISQLTFVVFRGVPDPAARDFTIVFLWISVFKAL